MLVGIGITEILLVAAVALLVVGPDRLPRVLRQLGRWYGQARRAADDLRRAFVLEADRQDAADRYSRLQERRKQAQAARETASLEAVEEPEDPQEDAEEVGVPGSVAQVAERPAGPPREYDDDVPTHVNADAPDAPHPTRPTPVSEEFP